ncbi:hypothetical protein BO70DRAFT_11830 [Aspergillus heteromorphus CBS 117.55]|uniref:Uncharacterized protein n=1 Tax=Aspergillus heteromorphus CBS 117.55 TaxID=1448321 RepID=A0A317X4P2_9EURO|nr:uncharacterized protein BO70DRAFT_11830 [Aspergillus heteromorphus CBS 117.55]PWY92487.1 hypothetical protein BO70DRAFT_11830 [Aspergillus heteromorphus CBS 117.55]
MQEVWSPCRFNFNFWIQVFSPFPPNSLYASRDAAKEACRKPKKRMSGTKRGREEEGGGGEGKGEEEDEGSERQTGRKEPEADKARWIEGEREREGGSKRERERIADGGWRMDDKQQQAEWGRRQAGH